MTIELRVCPAADVPPGSVVAVKIGELPVAVVHADDGQFYAIYDECSHGQVALSEGEVDGCTLECWLHGSRFDLRTGRPSGPPATAPVTVYPVVVRDGDLYLTIDPSDPLSDPASDGVTT